VRITHEADYAIRILFCLASKNEKMGAKELSDCSGVTPRFTLKILRKLTGSGLVKSFKGMKGGYALQTPAQDISIGQIVELIDGPIRITHCLDDDYACTRMEGDRKCEFHSSFLEINQKLRENLYDLKLSAFIHRQ